MMLIPMLAKIITKAFFLKLSSSSLVPFDLSTSCIATTDKGSYRSIGSNLYNLN